LTALVAARDAPSHVTTSTDKKARAINIFVELQPLIDLAVLHRASPDLAAIV